MDHRIRVRLVPPHDARFRAAVELAFVAASTSGADLDSPEAARRTQEDLRAHGFPAAAIGMTRSVEEYLRHVSHWTIWRDGSPGTTRRLPPSSSPVAGDLHDTAEATDGPRPLG